MGVPSDLHLFQNQVHRRDAEVAEGLFFLIQSGDGDWTGNSFPAELRIMPFSGYHSYCETSIWKTETFCLAGSLRQTKTSFSASSAALR